MAPDIEHALRSTPVVDGNKVAPSSDIHPQSLPDVAQQRVIVVSPQDMARIFGPTLWRKGFLPMHPSDASPALPAPPPVGSSGNRPTPTIAATRSFSTRIWRTAHSGFQGAPSRLFHRVVLPVFVYGMPPYLIRHASNSVGAVPRWIRSSVRFTSSLRSPMLRSAIVLGFGGIRGCIGRPCDP